MFLLAVQALFPVLYFPGSLLVQLSLPGLPELPVQFLPVFLLFLLLQDLPVCFLFLPLLWFLLL